MPHFPMFIDLCGKPVLVVGGGAVALRKVQKLLPFGPRLRVVAPEVCREIGEMPGVKTARRRFRPADLRPAPALVIAAAGDRGLNHRISRLCRAHHIPVNVADDPAACTFLFPALVTRGSLSAGVCTGGASPAAAAYCRERLEETLPDGLEEILSWLESRRPEVKAAVAGQGKRAAVFRALLDACLERGRPLTEEEAQACIRGAAPPVGSVALVGAGCGKADLITLRGWKLLRRCQAVVYDDLIDPALVDAAPESARRIYVGKRSGAHSAPQGEINRTLIGLARSGLQVVRLKGGDPYLFGRGGEEMEALRAAGVPCTEVPGIPSAIGIPAEAGIPVTHRGVSRGLHIVTAHTADSPGGLPAGLDALASLDGTLVFLMGLKQLPAITERLMAAGKAGDTPAAVISGGNSPYPAVVRAPLAELARAAEGVRAPAVILVGEVAAMDLSGSLPLAGVRVGITGTAQVAEKQCAALAALGAQTAWICRCAVRRRPRPDWPALLKGGGWLVFTSPNGVELFSEQLEESGLSFGGLRSWRCAVIGPATGAALERRGGEVRLCPPVYTSEALAAALAEAAAPGDRAVLPRSSIGSPALPHALREAGLTVRDIPLYDIEAEDGPGPEALPPLDYLTFSSASGVESFFRKYGGVGAGVKCVCIGAVTARALAGRAPDAPVLTAREAAVPALVRAIIEDRCRPSAFSPAGRR